RRAAHLAPRGSRGAARAAVRHLQRPDAARDRARAAVDAGAAARRARHRRREARGVRAGVAGCAGDSARLRTAAAMPPLLLARAFLQKRHDLLDVPPFGGAVADGHADAVLAAEARA